MDFGFECDRDDCPYDICIDDECKYYNDCSSCYNRLDCTNTYDCD